jgi:hypothetical protein
MTDQQQHRATPEQWALQERWGSHSCFEPDYDSSCILELRDRVTALEAGQTCPHIVSSDEGTSYCALAEQTHSKSTPNDRQIRSSAPADSLLERVARALYEAPSTHEGWRSAARAAIHEVARWMDENACDPDDTRLLREEANR